MGLEHLVKVLDQPSTKSINQHIDNIKRRRDHLLREKQPISDEILMDDKKWVEFDWGLIYNEIQKKDIKLHNMLNSPKYSEKQIKEYIKSLGMMEAIPVLFIGKDKVEELKYNYAVLEAHNLPFFYGDIGYRAILNFFHNKPDYVVEANFISSHSSLKNARKKVKKLKSKKRGAFVTLIMKDLPNFSRYVHTVYEGKQSVKLFDYDMKMLIAYAGIYQLVLPDIEGVAQECNKNLSNIEKISKFLVKSVKNRTPYSLSVLTIPDFSMFSKEESINIAKTFLSIIPNRGSRDNINFMPLTYSTSSECVGWINDLVFKVTKNKEGLEREILITEKLQRDKFLSKKVVHLYKPEIKNDSDPTNMFKLSKCSKYLTTGDLHVLLTYPTGTAMDKFLLDRKIRYTEDGKPYYEIKNVKKPKQLSRKQKIKQNKKLFNLSKKLNIDFEKIYNNSIIQRLHLLSYLHSNALNLFSKQELEMIDTDDYKYHDYTREQVRQKTKSSICKEVLNQYEKASQRQQQLYEQRRDCKQDSLVMTHGDAKFDNWIDDFLLIDFGSAKIQTEYKDIAKSLLDSAHIMDNDVIDGYLEVYAKLRQMMNNPIKECFESFKRNVYDAILTETVRTVYYKSQIPGCKFLARKLSEIADHYSQKIADMERGDE